MHTNKIPQPRFSHIESPKPAEPHIDKKSWGFSFKYFKQIENFGLNRSDSSWFASLLEKLAEMSKLQQESLSSDINLKSSLRYHSINWTAKNIPIEKSDLNWIDDFYLNNDKDYPFFQFQISKALGRVIGFWNERHDIFFIVLLDPMHNMQPSKYSDYKIRDCSPLESSYTLLLNKISNVIIKQKQCSPCNILREIQNESILHSNHNIVVFLEDDFLKHLDSISKTHSISEIFEAGIYSLIDTSQN